MHIGITKHTRKNMREGTWDECKFFSLASLCRIHQIFYLFDGRIRGHDVNRCLTSLASIFVSLHMSTEVCNVVLKVSFVSLVDFWNFAKVQDSSTRTVRQNLTFNIVKDSLHVLGYNGKLSNKVQISPLYTRRYSVTTYSYTSWN